MDVVLQSFGRPSGELYFWFSLLSRNHEFMIDKFYIFINRKQMDDHNLKYELHARFFYLYYWLCDVENFLLTQMELPNLSLSLSLLA